MRKVEQRDIRVNGEVDRSAFIMMLHNTEVSPKLAVEPLKDTNASRRQIRENFVDFQPEFDFSIGYRKVATGVPDVDWNDYNKVSQALYNEFDGGGRFYVQRRGDRYLEKVWKGWVV